MDAAGAILIAVLAVIATIHLSWALGSQWPGTDPISLHARVVGTPGYLIITRWMWAAIAACFYAAIGVIWLAHLPAGDLSAWPVALIVYPGYVVLILVFTMRGLAPYLTQTFRYARATPFYTLNRRYYAPLCLLIAAGLVIDFPPGLDRFFPR